MPPVTKKAAPKKAPVVRKAVAVKKAAVAKKAAAPKKVAAPKKAAPKKSSCPERLLSFLTAAQDMKAYELLALDLRPLTSFTDYFIVCTGTSDRQVQAIAEEIRQVRKRDRELPTSYEGYETGQWVLIDYGDVVVHVFQKDAREFYQIEHLWADAPQIPLP